MHVFLGTVHRYTVMNRENAAVDVCAEQRKFEKKKKKSRSANNGHNGRKQQCKNEKHLFFFRLSFLHQVPARH